MSETSDYTINDWLQVFRANETDIYTMRPREEVEAEEERRRQIDYLFPEINKHHAVMRAVKIYDADTGKQTNAIIEENAAPLQRPYVRGILAGVMIGMIVMIAANILTLMVI